MVVLDILSNSPRDPLLRNLLTLLFLPSHRLVTINKVFSVHSKQFGIIEPVRCTVAIAMIFFIWLLRLNEGSCCGTVKITCQCRLMCCTPSYFFCLQGWSIFSSSASKIANKASESAFRISEIASNKVADISVTVSEKVCFILFYDFINLYLYCCPTAYSFARLKSVYLF